MEKVVIRAYDLFAEKPVRITLHEGKIEEYVVFPQAPDIGQGEGLPYVVPGFFDIQVNGYLGRDFTSPHLTVDDVYEVANALWKFGVTQFLPTVTTHSHDVLTHCVRTIAQAVNEFPILKYRIPGIHLEGPHISREDGPRGAHPKEHVRMPDWNEFCRLQEAATGLIRLVTISPEYETALDFIAKAARSGVTVAIGHTAASPRQIRDAIAAGASMSTHLGNGCHLTLPRHPNYLWEQLAADDLYASFIVDGFHLPGAFIKVALRAKGDRALLVSDLSAMAGLPPGRYSTPLCELEILQDGRLVVAGQRKLLAGASQPITTGIMNAVLLGGVTLREAVAMTTTTPCRVLGMEPSRFLPGVPANLVLFDVEENDQGTDEITDDSAKGKESPGLLRKKIGVRAVYFRGETWTQAEIG
ncbi:MAG: N-acetylglucosamine-6-phosphate deacetylase [Thermogutta sp.]